VVAAVDWSKGAVESAFIKVDCNVPLAVRSTLPVAVTTTTEVLTAGVAEEADDERVFVDEDDDDDDATEEAALELEDTAPDPGRAAKPTAAGAECRQCSSGSAQRTTCIV
jgi:hypothetical protein